MEVLFQTATALLGPFLSGGISGSSCIELAPSRSDCRLQRLLLLHLWCNLVFFLFTRWCLERWMRFHQKAGINVMEIFLAMHGIIRLWLCSAGGTLPAELWGYRLTMNITFQWPTKHFHHSLLLTQWFQHHSRWGLLDLGLTCSLWSWRAWQVLVLDPVKVVKVPRVTSSKSCSSN